MGRLLARHHPVELALGWPLARWLAVAGVGPARASRAGGGVRAWAAGALERPACRAPIRGPEDVLRARARPAARARREHFVVLLLNARHELERRETVSIG